MSTEMQLSAHATGLASFRAAEANGLEVSSAPDEAHVITVIRFDGNEFTLGLRAGAPGVVVPLFLRLLQGEELRALLDALQDQLAHPTLEPGLDIHALHAFVAVLTAHVDPKTTNRFEEARFGSASKDPHGAIVGHLGLGTDVVGTVHDYSGSITYEQHVASGPPGHFRRLSQADVDSLTAALTAAEASPVHIDPLWSQVLKDLRG